RSIVHRPRDVDAAGKRIGLVLVGFGIEVIGGIGIDGDARRVGAVMIRPLVQLLVLLRDGGRGGGEAVLLKHDCAVVVVVRVLGVSDVEVVGVVESNVRVG